MSNTANPSPEFRNGSTDESPVDELFGVLTTARRRHVLSILTQRRSSMAVDELADAVAARENDADATTPSASTVEEVHVTLHHVHLPKLDDVGLIEYDRDDRTVASTGTTDAVSIDIE